MSHRLNTISVIALVVLTVLFRLYIYWYDVSIQSHPMNLPRDLL